jgi:hypothetical protein
MVSASALWSKADPNVAGFIAAQAGAPVLFTGKPGVGKSQVIKQAAKAWRRRLSYVIGSCHAPEDFSGIPFLSESKDYFLAAPPKWASSLTTAGAMLFCDELTTVPPSVRAALLQIFSELQIGDLVIHPDTIFMAACNPPEWAPNASPLEKSMANRFAHFEWKHDYEAWKAGMNSEDDTWGTSFVPVVAPDWKRYRPMFGTAITSYTDKNSAERIAKPEGDEVMAYATPRTWRWCRDALAAAESCGAPKTVKKDIAVALVGRTTGRNLMQFIEQRDLVDPEEVLANRKTFKHDKTRPDLTVTLLVSVVTAIKTQYSESRMDAAVELFCNNVGQDTADLVFTQLRHLIEGRPEGTELTKKSLAAIGEFGKRIPAEMRKRKAG